MADDADTPTEREMKDFQFRQMKKLKVFDAAEEMPRERSSLLMVSNKFGLTFVGLNRTFKVYVTRDVLNANNAEGKANEIVEGILPLAEVTLDLNLHHLALSSDELTLSVCGVCDEAKLSLVFYDVRTFVNKARPQKFPFASLQPPLPSGTLVQDLKWNPALPALLAVGLSDGSLMTLEVTEAVKVLASLPASSGITCLCWSPKGKQVAAGKMNATVCQYTPLLEEKKVIQCPDFYNSEDPVKVLDVLWLKTLAFAVVYAAADRSLDTPPELVFVSLPKKEEKPETKYLNFRETVYGSCTDRHHHYFLNHIEDWDLVFVASAGAIEVSIIARQDEKIWELWNLEDSSRAELSMSKLDEDTLPLGIAIDFTSQQEIYITDEKSLPPAPTLLMLSSEGLLCPFSLLNLNPGAKQLVAAPTALSQQGERLPKPGSSAPVPPKPAPSVPSAAPVQLKSGGLFSIPASTPAVAAAATSASPFSFAPSAPATSSSSGFIFSVPTTTPAAAPPAFSLGASTAFGSGASSFSFAKPPSDTPSAPSAFSFSSPSIKPSVPTTPALNFPPQGQSLPAVSAQSAKSNLNERLAAAETPASTTPSFSFTPTLTKAAVPNASSLSTSALGTTKTPALIVPVHPVQTGSPSPAIPKTAPAAQNRVQTPQAITGVKMLEKPVQQKKETDPIMNAIMEEISHFQKELDDLKERSSKADFKIGTNEQMKALRKDSEELHSFTLEIKETTESVHGDIGTLKTTLLEGFAGAEEAKAQSELGRDRNYRQLLYKRPLDPRSEEQLKEIRRLYQYVTFAVEDVNDVLDVEWEKHLEKKKKKLKHMVVPGREGLFTTLSNNLYIINQQKNRLDNLVKELSSLRLYNKTTPLAINNEAAAATTAAGLESELESLKDALLKAKLDTSPQVSRVKSPEVKVTPGKQSQLRNFLSKGQMPPVRSTAPANLSRSAFLSPKYDEDLDDDNSTSFPCTSIHPLQLGEEEEELQNQLPPMKNIHPSLATPRHPNVVRTPSIQPGFGTIQSTPLTAKIQSLSGIGFPMSPIASHAIRGNLSGADSTALATKTVKHGAPPSDRATPVAISAHQAAAAAALQRQMANQKAATSLTESTLKTVPQVVNVVDFKEKGFPNPNSSTASDPTSILEHAFAMAKRNSNQSFQKDASAAPQTAFVFAPPPKIDMSAITSSASEHSSQPFNASSAFSSVSLGTGTLQVKEKAEFTFGNGKLTFGQSDDEPFSFAQKSISSTSAPATSSNAAAESAKAAPGLSAFEPQPPKTTGGETVGIFSGVRVGQGGEATNAPGKPAVSSFAFGDSNLASSYNFKSILNAPPNPAGTDPAKGDGGSLFKPSESSSKLSFSVPVSNPAAAVFGIPDSAPGTRAASDRVIPAETPAEAAAVPPPEAPEAAKETVDPEPVTAVEAPTPPLTSTAMKASNPSPSIPAAPEAATVTSAAPSTHPDSTTTTITTAAPTTTVPPPSAPPPVEASLFQIPGGDKPGSIFTQPLPTVTDSSSLSITPVINTVAAVATTPTISVASTPVTTPSLFGQPADTTAPSSAPNAPAPTGFASAGFGASAETGFGKPVFGQVGGFGQPASNAGSASGFSFAQSAFGASASSTATTGGGGGLFGAPTATNASSFSFGSGSPNPASSTGTGLFGQSTAPAFGQSSGFGQASTFGGNTTTSSSGFGFGQPSGFGCSPAAPVFGQQANTGSVFGQPQASTAVGLFGSSSANQSGSSAGGGFFSGLGGKPSEDAANKNPFGAPSSAGGFGQAPLAGTNSLFGNSPAKTMGFGQATFGEQKPSSTFSTGGTSVAAQGFGSFASPTKPGGFGSAPVFGSPPAFGSSPSFGASASFGASPSFNANMGSTGKVFGEGTAASNMGGFGFSSPTSAPSFGALANQSPSTFGAIAQQGAAFGSQPNSFSGFGQPQPQPGGFTGNTFGSPNQPSNQTFAGWRC